MGQLESKEHSMFIQLLQSMINSHGHDIKSKTVEEFEHIVREICSSTLRDYVGPPKTSPPTAPPYASVAPPPPIAAPSATSQPPLYVASPPPDPHDLAERGSNFSHSRYPPLDDFQPLAEVLVDKTRAPNNSPQWTPGPVTFSLPPDLARQFQDLLSLCFLALSTQQQQCFPVTHRVQSPATPGAVTPVPLRSTATSPISPLSHALMPMHRGFADSDNLLPVLYPIMEVVDDRGEALRNYDPIAPKVLRELKEAVSSYGPTAPYTLTLLDNLAFSAMPPADWGRLTKASLSGGDFLLWKAYYEDGAYEQAQRNRRQQSPIIMDMLMGRGQYEDFNTQIAMPTEAFVQINGLAVQAWRQLSSSASKTEELAKIRQGPDEPYQDFASHLLQAVSRQVGDEEAGAILVRQLACENANTACQAAIRS
ncbi:Gag polyprotein [Plecturocebus cupreus]